MSVIIPTSSFLSQDTLVSSPGPVFPMLIGLSQVLTILPNNEFVFVYLKSREIDFHFLIIFCACFIL